MNVNVIKGGPRVRKGQGVVWNPKTDSLGAEKDGRSQCSRKVALARINNEESSREKQAIQGLAPDCQ